MKLRIKSVSNALTLVASLFLLAGCASKQESAMFEVPREEGWKYDVYRKALDREVSTVQIHYIEPAELRKYYAAFNIEEIFDERVLTRNVGFTSRDKNDVCHIYVLKPVENNNEDHIHNYVLGHELKHCFIEQYHVFDFQRWEEEGCEGKTEFCRLEIEY